MPQALLITVQLMLLMVISWMGMMLVHEAGHVLGAWLTGGRVQRVVWHPLAISRTDVSPNPQALIVVWMGPVVGVLVPLGLWSIGWIVRWRWRHLIAAFTGFCLIANGAYIGMGVFEAAGDTREMLRLGTPRWAMLAFGLPCVVSGLWMWHCASMSLGIGRGGRVPTRGEVVVLALLMITMLSISLAVDSNR